MKKITLKAARVNAKFTQAQAAELVGVCTHTLIRYERGLSIPRGDTLIKFATAYNRPIDSIIFCPETR